jgi:hypothetical protein
MASPMRMRGGGVVEIDCSVIAAAGADAGEDDAASGADDLATRADDDDATAGADVFALRADGRGAAEDAGDFAMRLEDRDGATVVASPKASVSALSIAAGDASFERLRLLERVLLVRAAGFLVAVLGLDGDAAVADAFRFFGMGLCVVAAARRREIAAGVRCC